MRVSYNWLKEYVDLKWSPDEVSAALITAGFEIAGLIETPDNDTILDIELTVNRGDCLSFIGIAREVSALIKKPLKLSCGHSSAKSKRLSNSIKVSIVEQNLCPRYTCRIIEGIKVAPSPVWLKEKLEKVGISTVNNVVDVTNLVMMELGHPMHAFDYHTLANKSIIVCQATEGEKIHALNGQTYNLSPNMLIVADTERPIALAGIIGSVESSVNEKTSAIVLECAYFLPKSVRNTARQLGIQTESSYRFEREIDIDGLYKAQNRATQLILELCEGWNASEIIDEYPIKFKKIDITLRPTRVNKVLGTQIEITEMIDILKRLEFKVLAPLAAEEDILNVTVPSFRHDITREIDLIEEISRIYGYHRIPTTLPTKSNCISINEDYKINKTAKSILTACGFYEVITYAFSNIDLLNKAQICCNNPIIVQNPLSKEDNMMCISLIPNLLKTLSWNINRGETSLKIFELSRVFLPSDNPLPVEKEVLCAAIIGDWRGSNWQEQKIESNLTGAIFYYLKGIVEKLMEELGIVGYNLEASPIDRKSQVTTPFHPGQCAIIKYNEKELGIIGQIHPIVTNNFNLPSPVYLFELDWKAIVSLSNQKRTFKPLPKYPSVVRDLAIVVAEDVQSDEIVRIIENRGNTFIKGVSSKGKSLLKKVVLFDLYQGEKIEQGKKSLAYSLTYRSDRATLTDEVINKIHNEIVEALQKELKASLR